MLLTHRNLLWSKAIAIENDLAIENDPAARPKFCELAAKRQFLAAKKMKTPASE